MTQTGIDVGVSGQGNQAFAQADYGVIHSGHIGSGEIFFTIDVTPPPNTVATSTRSNLPVPQGAIINAARFVVVVNPPGRSRIGDVAEVRAVPPDHADASEFVIDFKTMQTVSGIDLPVAPGFDVYPWVGNAFSTNPVTSSGGAIEEIGRPGSMVFQEVLTERLRCVLNSAVAQEAFDGEVVLPSPPAFVEVLINDVRAWFSTIGPASPRTHDGVDGVHSFVDVVDLTSAMQVALDADGELGVELRTSSAAQLQFRTDVLQFFRIHDVRFSEGPTRAFEAPDEGLYEIDLPLPDEEATESWHVHAVELQLRAEIDDTRIYPPTGPPLATDVELVLAESRTLLVKLPARVISRFGTIAGVRVPARAGPAGGELAGELLRNDATTDPSRPGTEIANGGLEPVTVPASDDVAYVTLKLKKPYEPAPDGTEALWATLRATRGEITWALSLPLADDDLAGANVRWRAPNGSARHLSSFTTPGVEGAAPHAGAVRIVGKRDPNRPLDALTVEMAGTTDAASLTPFGTGSPVRLDLGDPLSPGKARSLRVRFLISAPGSYTVDSARLIYIDPALDEPHEPMEETP